MAYIRLDWDDIDKEKFPETLKRYRLFRGYTQAKLAEKVGVKNTTISNYEKGVSLPDIDTVKKIARVLRVDPGEFYIDWRFRSQDALDVVPVNVQVEYDILTRKYTNWFVALPDSYYDLKLRAWLVPKDYLCTDDKRKHFVVMTPLNKYSDGDTIVAIADNAYPFIGIYGYDEDGNELLKPITRWNPDYNKLIRINRCASFTIIGKVILFDTKDVEEFI